MIHFTKEEKKEILSTMGYNFTTVTTELYYNEYKLELAYKGDVEPIGDYTSLYENTIDMVFDRELKRVFKEKMFGL